MSFLDPVAPKPLDRLQQYLLYSDSPSASQQ